MNPYRNISFREPPLGHPIIRNPPPESSPLKGIIIVICVIFGVGAFAAFATPLVIGFLVVLFPLWFFLGIAFRMRVRDRDRSPTVQFYERGLTYSADGYTERSPAIVPWDDVVDLNYTHNPGWISGGPDGGDSSRNAHHNFEFILKDGKSVFISIDAVENPQDYAFLEAKFASKIYR
jgi:hypothetical protein